MGAARGQGIESHRAGRGIWVAGKEGVHRLVHSREPVPSFRKTHIDSFGGATRLGAGRYLIAAAMVGNEVYYDDSVGLFLMNSGDPTLILQRAKQTPSGLIPPALIKSIEHAHAYNQGLLVTTETIRDGVVGWAVWRWTGKSFTLLTHDADRDTGLSEFPSFSMCDIKSLNSKGDAILQVRGRESALSNIQPVGLVLAPAKGELKTIFVSGMNANLPSDDEVTFDRTSNFISADINDQGVVAFSASADDETGVWKVTTDGVQFVGALKSPTRVLLDNDGNVFATAGSPKDVGLYTEQPDGLTPLIAKGVLPAEIAAEVNNFRLIDTDLSDSGLLAIRGAFDGGNGLWVRLPSGDISCVVKTGDRVDIAGGPRIFERRVQEVAGYQVNPLGVMAVILRLQDNQTGVFRVTKSMPESVASWE